MEVDRRRSSGFGRGVGRMLGGEYSSRDVCERFLPSELIEGLKGGGSLRGPFVTAEVGVRVLV